MIGQVGEALQDAGILTPAMRLRKIARAALGAGEDVQNAIVQSGDVEAALTLANPRDVAYALKKLIEELERDRDQPGDTGNSHGGPIPVRSTEMRTVEGQGYATGNGHGQVTPDSAQQNQDVAGQTSPTDGQIRHTRHSPGHAKQRSQEALDAVSAVVARSVLDTFAIIDRNGERLPIGDIRIASYDRIIRMTSRRSWSATREHHVMVLLKAEAERRAAYIPDEATTRDIFDAESVERLLTMATTMATPTITDTAAQDAAA
jgi:hypothetical protein